MIEVKYAPVTPADIYTVRLGGVYDEESREPPFVAGHDAVAAVAKVGGADWAGSRGVASAVLSSGDAFRGAAWKDDAKVWAHASDIVLPGTRACPLTADVSAAVRAAQQQHKPADHPSCPACMPSRHKRLKRLDTARKLQGVPPVMWLRTCFRRLGLV